MVRWYTEASGSGGRGSGPGCRESMRYPVSQPELGADERRRLLRAFDAGTISSIGPEVREFEDAFARALGARHAVAVSSGTAALHLALAGLGVGPGDEVVVPALTFAAAANAVQLTGARVVPR